MRDVDRLLAQVDEGVEVGDEAFHELDRQVFLAHWSAARHLDRDADGRFREAELLERYRFHAALQGLLRGMLGEQARLHVDPPVPLGQPAAERGGLPPGPRLLAGDPRGAHGTTWRTPGRSAPRP